MKRKFLKAVFSLNVLCGGLIAQTTIDLTPIQDATINSLSSTTNYGSSVHFNAAQHTSSGVPYTLRSLMVFDLSQIPSGATINSATLYLSADNHYIIDQSTASIIKRITEDWEDTSVTWDTKPEITGDDQANLDAANSTDEDYSPDLTAIIQHFIDNPGENNGIMLMLEADDQGMENPYAELQFKSIDNSDTTNHPKLEVQYTEAFSVSSTISHVTQGPEILGSISLTPSGGTTPYSYAWSNGQTTSSISGLTEGTYTVTITDNSSAQSFQEFEVLAEVNWTNKVGVTESNGEITKNTSAGWTNSGASSTTILSPDKDGALTYTKGSSDSDVAFGLSETDTNQNYTSILYAFLINSSNVLSIYESGTLISSHGSLTSGDQLSIERIGSFIKYKKNGTTIRTTTTNASKPLIVDASIYANGSKIGVALIDFRTKKANYYANLKHELDASYYKAYNSILRFKYRERYSTGTLTFNVYDELHLVKLDESTFSPPKSVGINWFDWNLKTISSNFQTNKYYVLEVFDENGRSQFLRFKVLGSELEYVESAGEARISTLNVEPAK